MNLSRCANGHFYDKEKYSTCPHCSGGSASDANLTEVFTTETSGGGMNPLPAASDFTEQVPQSVPLPVAGMSANQQTMAMPVAPTAFDTPTVPLQPEQQINNVFMTPGAQPGGMGAPGGMGMSGSMGAPGGMGMSGGAQPVSMAMGGFDAGVSEAVDEDDDHTVGIFDLDMGGPAASAPAPAASPVQASAFGVPAARQAAPFGAPVQNVSAPKAQMAGAARSHRLSTPCVGWLVALNGEHVGTDFRLKAGKNFIGRNAQMDIPLTDDKSVSRDKHAIVVYDPKQHLYMIQPGESSSLVYKNNEVVLMPVKLAVYDKVTVGEVDLLFIPLCGPKFNWNDILKKH